MVRESEALFREPIEPRCLNDLLAVAAEIPVAEVVGDDVDEVGLLERVSGRSRVSVSGAEGGREGE